MARRRFSKIRRRIEQKHHFWHVWRLKDNVGKFAFASQQRSFELEWNANSKNENTMGQTTGRAKGKERSSQLQWPTEQDNWAPSSIGLLRKSFVHDDLVRVFKHSEC